jgi:hypothetical protein
MMVNLYAAWIGILAGCIAGAIPGLFFYREGWLGGYGSWPRRMIRLGHISLFGIAFINLSFFLTSRAVQMETGVFLSSVLFVTAAVAMPLICYLSAFRPVFRHLFFIPVLSVLIGTIHFLWRLLGL